RLRVLAPIALVPNNLDVAVVEESGLGVVDVYARTAVAHQNAARRRNALRPAQIQEHARDVEEVDAEIARLSIAEFARVAPAPRVDARIVVAPGGRADIHFPVQGGGRRSYGGKGPAAAVIAVNVHVCDLPKFAAFNVA